VLAAQGIARGSGTPAPVPAPVPSAAPKESPSPSSIAAEIADRLFGSSTKKGDAVPPGECPPEGGRYTGSAQSAKASGAAAPIVGVSVVEKKSDPPAAAAIQVFVSENDVRRAMTRSEKIFIGRKTILTPSARDLGVEHEVFVETEAGSLR
jgi:hypothetical protein